MKNQINPENLKFPIGKYQKPISVSEKDLKKWIETIEDFPNKLKKRTKNLSSEELNYNYRPDGWTIKQVIHHCADSHMNSFMRFKLALTEQNPTIKPYDEAKWAALVDGNNDNISASLLIIEGLHNRWALLLKSFNESDFEKTFFHPESQKNIRLDVALAIYNWHCNHHFAHIEQALNYKGKF